MCQVKVGDLNIAYRYEKKGRQTLVFLHGNSTGKAVFDGLFPPLIARGYSVLSLDLPGHGESSDSSTPEKDYTFPALAKLVQAVLGKLNISDALVVGWSLGGHVLIEMVGQGYEVAGGLIMGTPPLGPGSEDFEDAFLPSRAIEAAFKSDPSDEDWATFLYGVYGVATTVPASFRQLAERTDGTFRAHVSAHWINAVEGHQHRDIIRDWKKPLCVIHGADDVFISKSYLQNLTWGNLWQNKIIEIEEVGHAPFLEAPLTFHRILLDFADVCFTKG